MRQTVAFKRRTGSADERPVKVWKLRAIIYGLLAAVAAIVLFARPGGSSSDGPSLRTLAGVTAQGEHVKIGMLNGHVRYVWVVVKPSCGRSAWWHPAVGLQGVEYHEIDGRIDLYERWTDAVAAFHARASGGPGKLQGTIHWTWRSCHRSEPISFSVSG